MPIIDVRERLKEQFNQRIQQQIAEAASGGNKRQVVKAYVKPDIKARMAELLLFYGTDSESRLVEGLLEQAISDMEAENTKVLLEKSKEQEGVPTQ